MPGVTDSWYRPCKRQAWYTLYFILKYSSRNFDFKQYYLHCAHVDDMITLNEKHSQIVKSTG